jgi:hypothetical protein
VAYHQDLTISVDKKAAIEDFGPWTIKQNQYAVQPPLQILENIYTIRIHLDETNQDNGALKVIRDRILKKSTGLILKIGILRPKQFAT